MIYGTGPRVLQLYTGGRAGNQTGQKAQKMRALFSIVGLLMVLVIVGMLVKKQMSNTVAVPAISVPSASGSTSTTQVKPADVPAHVKRELDAATAQSTKRVETEESK